MTDLILVFLIFLAAMLSAMLFRIRLREARKQMAAHEKELRRNILRSSILAEITRRIGYSMDVREIVEIIAESLGDAVPYATVSSLVLDRDRNRLILRTMVRAPVCSSFIVEAKDRMLAAFEAISGARIRAFPLDEHVIGSVSEQTECPFRSFFNLPFMVEGEFAGLITIASPDPGIYTERETAFLYSIAEQAATAVKRLRTVIANETKKMDALVSSLAGGILMIDQEDRVVVFNRKIREILQFPADKKPHLHEIVSSLGEWLDLSELLKESSKTGAGILERNVSMRDKFYRIIASTVQDQSGTRLGTVVDFFDQTAERELERLREDFTAMMVHELRAPLTAMRWSIEMLLDKPKPTKKTLVEPLSLMKDAAGNMLGIVNDLLDAAKIDAGKFQILPKDEEDLSAVIREKLMEFKPQAEQKGLELIDESEKGLPLFRFDRSRIGQVLTNLLSNALKHTERGSVKVAVSSDPKKKRVRVEVRDTGEGIDPEAQKRLFQKFSQVGAGDVKRTGTGLGLAIVKGIVEAHGGSVGVTSEKGKGSTFWFELPMEGMPTV